MLEHASSKTSHASMLGTTLAGYVTNSTSVVFAIMDGAKHRVFHAPNALRGSI